MKPTRKRGVRPTLRSVLGRGHLSVALLAVGLAGMTTSVSERSAMRLNGKPLRANARRSGMAM